VIQTNRFLIPLLATTSAALANLAVSYPGAWNGTDWVSKKITVTNTAATPIHLTGIRFDTPAKVWTGSSEATVSTLTGSSPYRVQMILNNLEVNYVGKDVRTFEITGSPNGKDGTPSKTSYLVRNGSFTWPLPIPFEPAVKLSQIDSLMKTTDFYNEKLGILDTLGQRGGELSGGMVDTWFGLTQLQSALPTKPFNQNATWMTFEPKSYGNSMYMMALAAMQEYFSIDMQMLIAKGGKENMAGMVQWNSLGNTYGEKLGNIYGTGGNGSGTDVDFGPFSVEHQTFKATVMKAHPKFYPLGSTSATNDYFVTSKGSSYCDLNKANVVNAGVICCMYNWYTYQLGLHSTDYGFAKLIREGKDRQGAMKLALWAFNRGTSVGWLDVVSSANIDQAITYEQIENFPKISERIYIDGISAALKPLIESARNSVTLGGTEPVYDDTISIKLVEQFLFGTGGSGSSGALGDGGLLVHFSNSADKNKQLWNDVSAAFDKMKGKAPSTKQFADKISYRYDWLTILRVIKGYIDVSIPMPTNYAFSAWEKGRSSKSVTMDGLTRDGEYPQFTVEYPTSIGGVPMPYVTATDNGTVRSVEWTQDTTLAEWHNAWPENIAQGVVNVDFKAPSPDLIGKPFRYWIRVTDSWGNAEIKEFSAFYTENGVAVQGNSKAIRSGATVRIDGGTLTLSGHTGSAKVELFTVSGRSVFKADLVINGAELSVAHLAKGLYVLQLIQAGAVSTVRVQIN